MLSPLQPGGRGVHELQKELQTLTQTSEPFPRQSISNELGPEETACFWILFALSSRGGLSACGCSDELRPLTMVFGNVPAVTSPR